MADLIRVTMAVDLLVDDPKAMRDAAFKRLRAAWTAEDDFPYSSASDLSTAQVVNSLLADALPLELPGCRRGRLDVESKGEAEGGDESGSDDESEGRLDDSEPEGSGRSEPEGEDPDQRNDETAAEPESGGDER